MAEPATPSAAAASRRLAPRAAIFALIAFALAFQGSRGIWDPDEGRYTAVALRMLRSGDWFTPALSNEVPHFSKPPLTYWALASSIGLFGRNEWAARLPNALAFVATVLLAGALARRLAPGREQLAAVVQATSLLPFVAANVVTTDTLLTAFETLAVAGFVEHRFGGADRRLPLCAMWLGFGLAFLTKGPPGLLPLLAILAFSAWTDGARVTARLFRLPALAVFAVVAFGWYAAQLRVRPDLLGYLLGTELAARVTSEGLNRSPGVAGILQHYVPVLLVGALPWAPWAMARAWRQRGAKTRPASDPGLRFVALWLLLPLAVFFASQSRLPLYLLPLSVPASLAIARALPADAFAPRRRRRVLAAWALLLVGLRGLGGVWVSDRDGRRLARELAASLPYPPAELVVVNRKAPYSLSFYFDVDVERVALESISPPVLEPSYRPLLEPLRAELTERDRATIWLVPKRLDEVFVGELEAAGWRGRRIGEVEGLDVFVDPRPAPSRVP